MKSILIAEDDENLRYNLSEILTLNDYNVYVAEDGIQALELAKLHTPDMILSDIMMPNCDGKEFLLNLKNDVNLSSIPFVFLTAKSSYNSLREGMNLGADDYLIKPFKVEEVMNSIDSVFNKHKKYHEVIDELKSNLCLAIPYQMTDPLTAILGYSSILESGIENNMSMKEVKEMVYEISNSAKRLYAQIKKLTYYLNLNPANANTKSSIVKSTKLIIQHNADKSKNKFNRIGNIILNVEDSTINFDSGYFSFIIEELIENALKFSSDSKDVEIRGYSSKGQYIIKIKDSGIGMTKAQIEDIYKPLKVNQESSLSNRGIGLATIKKIMDLTNSEIQISSKLHEFTEVSLILNLDQDA